MTAGQTGSRAVGQSGTAETRGHRGARRAPQFLFRFPFLFPFLFLFLWGCGKSAPAVETIQAPEVAGTTESADPAVARDPASGDLLLSWVAGDSSGYHLYFARSRDRGASWSAPTRVTDRDHDIVPHAEASPRMVATNGVIALFWPNHVAVAGRRFPASHMRFSRSLDGGRSWSAAITLNDDTTRAPAGHTFHGATAVGNDTLIVAWLDSRAGAAPASVGDAAVHHDGDAAIYTALSADRGVTWSARNSMNWGDACPCCRVSLAVAPDGSVLAAWRGHFAGSVRDPVVAKLTPVRGELQRIRADGWVFQGCPHTGPALAVDENGATHVAWFTGKEGAAGVFYASASGNTMSFSEPIALLTGETLPAAHPAIVLTGGGPLVAMNLDARGQRALTLARIRKGKAETTTLPSTSGADHPHLLALPDGAAVVAWTEKQSSSRIRLAVVKG
jgi:BNR repeat protein